MSRRILISLMLTHHLLSKARIPLKCFRKHIYKDFRLDILSLLYHEYFIAIVRSRGTVLTGGRPSTIAHSHWEPNPRPGTKRVWPMFFKSVKVLSIPAKILASSGHATRAFTNDRTSPRVELKTFIFARIPGFSESLEFHFFQGSQSAFIVG